MKLLSRPWMVHGCSVYSLWATRGRSMGLWTIHVPSLDHFRKETMTMELRVRGGVNIVAQPCLSLEDFSEFQCFSRNCL